MTPFITILVEKVTVTVMLGGEGEGKEVNLIKQEGAEENNCMRSYEGDHNEINKEMEGKRRNKMSLGNCMKKHL